jgi:hypothetical protein
MNKLKTNKSKFIRMISLQNVTSKNFGFICMMLILSTIDPEINYLENNLREKIIDNVCYLSFYIDSELIAKYPKHFLLPGLENLSIEDWLNFLVYPLTVGHSQLVIVITTKKI